MPPRRRRPSGGRGMGASTVPNLPTDAVEAIVDQLASVAVACKERPMPWLKTLAQVARINHSYHAAAASKLQPPFWSTLCSARWGRAVPPTNNFSAHFLRRLKLEETHATAPCWRDNLHLLIEVYWESNEVRLPGSAGLAGAPRRVPAAGSPSSLVAAVGSTYCSHSLALREAAVEEVDDVMANASWHLPSLLFEPGDELRTDCHLALGSCILWRGDEQMLELIPHPQRSQLTLPAPAGRETPHTFFAGSNTCFMANARHDGHTCLQLGGSCHFQIGTIGATNPADGLGWTLKDNYNEEEGMRIDANIAVEIPCTTIREEAGYGEPGGASFGTQVTLTLSAHPEETFENFDEWTNFVPVDEWPTILPWLPWR